VQAVHDNGYPLSPPQLQRATSDQSWLMPHGIWPWVGGKLIRFFLPLYRLLFEGSIVSLHPRPIQGSHLQRLSQNRIMSRRQRLRSFARPNTRESTGLLTFPAGKVFKSSLPLRSHSSQPWCSCLPKLCYLRVLRTRC